MDDRERILNKLKERWVDGKLTKEQYEEMKAEILVGSDRRESDRAREEEKKRTIEKPEKKKSRILLWTVGAIIIFITGYLIFKPSGETALAPTRSGRITGLTGYSPKEISDSELIEINTNRGEPFSVSIESLPNKNLLKDFAKTALGELKVYRIDLNRDGIDEILVLKGGCFCIQNTVAYKTTIIYENDRCAGDFFIYDIRDFNKDGLKEIFLGCAAGQVSLNRVVFWDVAKAAFKELPYNIKGILKTNESDDYIFVNETFLEEIKGYNFSQKEANEVSYAILVSTVSPWICLMKFTGNNLMDVSDRYPRFYKNSLIPTYDQEIEALRKEGNKPWIIHAISNRQKLINKAIDIVNSAKR